METKPKKSMLLTSRTTATGLLLAGLLTAVGTLHGWSASQAEDKAKGEAMLRQAQADLADANKLYDASIRATQLAQHEQEAASQRRLEARKLQREAFLLIRDSNRMQAAELRARAGGEELQVKSESVELARLQALLAHDRQVIADAIGAESKIRDAAKNAPTPGEKTELTKMADSLVQQAAQLRDGEVNATEARITPIQNEINRLNADIKQLTDLAQRLAPMDK
jgi:hypothetical protein